jgi:hypothetical protein
MTRPQKYCIRNKRKASLLNADPSSPQKLPKLEIPKVKPTISMLVDTDEKFMKNFEQVQPEPWINFIERTQKEVLDMLTEIEKSKENHKKGDKKKAYEVISSLSRPQSRQNKSKVEVVVHDKKKAEEIKKDLRCKSKPRQKSKI